jgi:nitrite reductase/ring-hydroxylating ferredoxin subunit
MSEQEPVWRRDFPYTSEGEEAVTRREFARYLALASGSFALGNVGIAAWASVRRVPAAPPTRIVALDEVPEPGTFLFRYPSDDDPAILIRGAGEDVRAFSQKCTHLGCVVFLDVEHDLLECPCHEGFFSTQDGSVVSGPPERPLARIEVEVRDGEVWAVGYELGGGHGR